MPQRSRCRGSTRPLSPRTVDVGYEIAGSWINYSLPANAIDVRDRTLDVELSGPVQRDLLERLYTEGARRSSGLFDRADGIWKRILERPKVDVHTYVVSGPSCVVFTQSREKGWRYDLNQRDVVALTPAAARRLLCFFAHDRSFANNVTWVSGPADPLIPGA